MFTDRQQTGVPNGNAFKTQGINQRTQLVKPSQVNNIGLAKPLAQAAPSTSQSAQLTSLPEMQKSPSQINRMDSLPQYNQPSPGATSTDVTWNKYGSDTGMTASNGEPLVTNSTLIPGSPFTVKPSDIDKIRDVVRTANRDDLIQVLREIENGELQFVDSQSNTQKIPAGTPEGSSLDDIFTSR